MKVKALTLVVWACMWGANQALPAWYEALFVPPVAHRTLPDMLLDVLGDARTVLARVLWFQMDLYHEILDQQGTDLSQQVDVFPLERMAAYLDPSLEDAYDVMAWDLFKGHNMTDQALQVLDEGLGYNPNSYLLTFRKGLILLKSDRYREALRLGERAFDVATNDIDKLDALRIMFQSCKGLKEWQWARRVLDLWTGIRPGDPAQKALEQELERAQAAQA